MAYSSITKPGDHFNTVTYTGNGSTNAITGVGFQPDWVWLKVRSAGSGQDHTLYDAVRGTTKFIESNTTDAEATGSNYLTAFGTDGFTLGNDQSHVNASSDTYVSWNWLAAGATPSQTYTVKVVSDGGNKYRFDDYGTSAVTLDLQEGGTYTFDGSDSSMASHPIKLSETSNGTHGGGSSYNTGVTYQLDGSSVTESAYVSGYSSASSRKLIITVAASAPTLYYYCHYHSGMGGQANTNSTFGSSNFSGSIQANVSANTTAGFSIGTYSANATAGATVGHGLGVAPDMLIVKVTNNSNNWAIYHKGVGATKAVYLDSTSGETTDGWLNNTAPGASVFTLSGGNYGNASGYNVVFYAFAEKKGYSKFGSYTGNGSSDGPFIYTGFKPAFFMVKRTNTTGNWFIFDNKRNEFNSLDKNLSPNANASEDSGSERVDFLSNGFKIRTSSATYGGGSGDTYIYMCFSENPFVGNVSGTAVPVTAR
mgnify:CR=1 FL=1